MVYIASDTVDTRSISEDTGSKPEVPAETRKEAIMADTATARPTFTADDFAGLKIVQDKEPLPAITRGGKVAGERITVFDEPLKASIEHNSPFTTYLKPEMVPAARNAVNKAAEALNVGVRIVPNLKKDLNGQVVKEEIKDATGKVVRKVPVYAVETEGKNAGLVRFRFQGHPERRKAAPRAYSIINDPEKRAAKALKRNSDGEIIARGTHEEMKDALTKAKALTEKPAA